MPTKLPHKRVSKSAKHFLAAVVFNEGSKATLQETQGTLLPCMGFYYGAPRKIARPLDSDRI
jgi:hypothetical protein